VAILLRGHLADRDRAAAARQYRELALVDARRAVFARLIDADHPCPVTRWRAITRQIGRPCGRHAKRIRRERRAVSMQTAASTAEAIMFQPAIDTPNSDHCPSSHITACLPSSCARSASTLVAAAPPAVQALGPANQCCSTPTW